MNIMFGNIDFDVFSLKEIIVKHIEDEIYFELGNFEQRFYMHIYTYGECFSFYSNGNLEETYSIETLNAYVKKTKRNYNINKLLEIC